MSALVNLCEVKNRLREIRQSLNLTLEQAAERVGTTPKQISRLELGERRLSDHWIDRISKAYKCTFSDIFGENRYTPETVPLVGFVGVGEQVSFFGGREPTERVDAPPGAEHAVVIAVRGDAMWPVYRPGDTLFYEPRDDFDETLCLNQDCIVHVMGGGTYVKRVIKGSEPGRYRLTSYRMPDIEDVEIAWASPVLWVRRGR